MEGKGRTFQLCSRAPYNAAVLPWHTYKGTDDRILKHKLMCGSLACPSAFNRRDCMVCGLHTELQSFTVSVFVQFYNYMPGLHWYFLPFEKCR